MTGMATASLVGKMTEKTAPSGPSHLRNTCVIIPTFNAGSHWSRLQSALEMQGIRNDQVLVIDSSSTDDTQELVRRAGYRLKEIPTASFRHGATRQMAAKIVPEADFLVYLTQDAIPCGQDSLRNLLEAFVDPKVGAAYGRQLPRDSADPIESHSRLFNYSDVSDVRTLTRRKTLGIKAAFFSNSFAAYRRTAFDRVGGFPLNAIVSEEVTVSARMLMQGWSIAYRADATVYHSHPLTVRQEFSRYFDIGVHHSRERWLLDTFGTPRGEGLRFVASELRYLREHGPSYIPQAMFRSVSKWCAYQLGLHEGSLPVDLVEAISAHPNFWQDRRSDMLAKQAERDVDVNVHTAQMPRH